MGTFLLPFLAFLLLSISPSFGQRQDWDAQNYPNPTVARDWQRCHMRSQSLLCDPDDVFSESDRYRINYELGQLEARTRQVTWAKMTKGVNSSSFLLGASP